MHARESSWKKAEIHARCHALFVAAGNQRLHPLQIILAHREEQFVNHVILKDGVKIL